ncbi:galactofuranosylgalactofuranosylrhamnosyl-N-acetylglucosaminyl-diphospho-decaprenol beta-1,5/1,6-galactofuranosyltransferase [Actinomadura hallensis]|uniref:Galactofuranosylgalactofuranosylrhamnosyl-N-acetylglucosaminyl-diphospho-decaprenol beta-1,5/1,6-galactofuranosyltransferase n=1 Tax=Actinomadura hallensis TaxID=337895 RepID=A0A543I9H4_9ACTN|nr:galactofuranosylgalactofuranosylrhamnosyl-N-acetylglucosaminyl-diphospho-decaprenol beta-1,5/1,6-galactofuranosyltransferase [Actinomadura hallensis]
MTERAAQPELPPEPAKHDEIRPAPSDAATSSPVPSSPVPSSVAPSSPAPSHAVPAVPEEKLRVLHRVVMPGERDFDVLKLYVDGNAVFGRRTSDLKSAAERVLAEQDGDSAGATAPFRPASKDDSAEIIGRRSIVVPSGARVSFCSYFNAFPAGYWRRWSTIENVRLRLRARGEATILIYRSTGKGHLERVKSLHIASDTSVEETVDLPLAPFIDGGWYWFDIVADGRTAVLDSADWCAVTPRTVQGTATLGITTFNRPKFCVEQLTALAAAGDVLDVVDEILVVDQGTDRVEDHPDFPAAAAALGGRLRVIDQANLGGSGGFSRVMHETVQQGRSAYALLLDDDVILEPEGILRTVTFADLARGPMLIGGHMLDLYNRSVLHVFGETVARYRWWMTPAPHTELSHDLAAHPLRHTPWLHRRADVDYNAWWMCLIPVEVIQKIGLSLPFFIKWDDIEYGLRAKAAGYPTVSLPGAAVWHVPWHSKDVMTDWQAYFTERNRIVTALLYSPYERGGNMLKESLFITIKHALAMQYSTAELMLLAIEDALKGPEDLHPSIVTKMSELRELRAGFVDAQAKPDLDDFPTVRRRKPPRKGRDVAAPPKNRRAMFQTAILGAMRQVKPVGSFPKTYPEAVVPHVDQTWWLLTKYNSALVSSADGTKVSWYQRDPRRFWSLIRRASALHARLGKDWPALSRRYRDALPQLTSREEWLETFGKARRQR